jgi:hypothetical protein
MNFLHAFEPSETGQNISHAPAIEVFAHRILSKTHQATIKASWPVFPVFLTLSQEFINLEVLFATTTFVAPQITQT